MLMLMLMLIGPWFERHSRHEEGNARSLVCRVNRGEN
jgi:hypothetical protein